MRICYCIHSSPLGHLVLKGDEGYLSGLWIAGEKHASEIGADWEEDAEVFGGVIQQLDEYFAGMRKEFSLQLRFEEGTEFQRRVWTELSRIGYGETISYVELAQRVGSPRGMRAVGLANGKNPLSIVVPCHRVIGANGSLVGYGGGLEAKRWLLEHERRHAEAATLSLQQETAMSGK